ncbi:efflux RND transporter periplasmic adaptor subunit [Myroides ceti]|uniref:Efflux RND transporter periplasmic adaptor subunit n=1 Tax=Paenimyroides ceti TaxID=395087 RepID=A0ABT8CVR4_9FLAO|nr:efflux RND transporter periplasmic adaptor subunit [Paenimyroides ceti]MDN3707275.1 efflux RND transporter periplasmic adaptor subunit [Paenimyroides ceti]MDN3708953.1 efflux RND transporter periplasmic adaptor subunit [Paenimyroides ceti]
MNKLKNIFRNKAVTYGVILLSGLLLGWTIFGGNSSHDHGHDLEMEVTEEGETVWTCSMHPQIRMDKPGKCPLCAMDLIPLKSSGGGDDVIDDDAILMSEEAIALANIQTSVVGHQDAVKDVQLYGTVQVDERLQQSQTSHVNGRIENLYVTFTGESVKEGQLIAKIYSPDLLTAQQELLEAAKLQDIQPVLLDAAKEKLRLWKVSENQISEILASNSVSPYVNIYANTSGVVTSKNVNQGDYINQGSVLYTISNLSKLWVIFDAYETDLPFLKVGDQLEYTLQSVPGKVYKGRIAFINPIIDASSRTAKVRVEADNIDRNLKPEMYATGRTSAPLKGKGKEIVIPKSAVLWTGKRSIVYVKQPNTSTPAFKLREIVLGPSLGDQYVVMSGLENGEEIVTKGAFTVDASAQLEGKISMMNNDGAASAAGHQHGDAQTNVNKTHDMLKVSGNCEMCKSRIEKAAKSVKGVISANWDVNAKVIHLDFDSKVTSKSAISKAIANVGHDTELDKAPKAVYDGLPSCCLYDRR